MSYNLSAISEGSTGMLGFIQGVNEVLMFGWLGIIILIVTCVIIFISFMVSTNEVKKSIMATSFISFGLSLFLKAVGLVPDLAIFITLIITALSIGWSFSSEG